MSDLNGKILGDDPPDIAAMKQFQEACARVVDGSRVDRAAAMGYIMGMCAQVVTQAVLDVLKRKNLISEAELRRAIADSYGDVLKQLSGSNGVILPPGPAVRRPS